jgi:hypothetical protein
MNEEERRQARLKLAQQLADEIYGWSPEKLRNTYAQPETVKEAEQRMNDGVEALTRRAAAWALALNEHLPRTRSERLYVVRSPQAICGPTTLRECERWIDGYIAAKLERR